MVTIITRKRWRWIGHVLRKDANSITKVAIHWIPEGKRKHGRTEDNLAEDCGSGTEEP